MQTCSRRTVDHSVISVPNTLRTLLSFVSNIDSEISDLVHDSFAVGQSEQSLLGVFGQADKYPLGGEDVSGVQICFDKTIVLIRRATRVLQATDWSECIVLVILVFGLPARSASLRTRL